MLLHGRRQWHPTPVLLPGKSHGWRSLVGCIPWGRTELDTTEATQQQHVAAYGIISFFLWLSNIPSCMPVYMCVCMCTCVCVCVHQFFFTNSSVRHLGCFHTLPIVNSVAMTIGVHVYFQIKNFLWIYTQEYNYRILCKSFQFLKEPPYCSPQWRHQFAFIPTVQENSFPVYHLQHLLLTDFKIMVILTNGTLQI